MTNEQQTHEPEVITLPRLPDLPENVKRANERADREHAEKIRQWRQLAHEAGEEIARNRSKLEAEDRLVTAEARRQAADVAERQAREGRARHEDRALKYAIRAARANDANERAQSEAKMLANWRKAETLQAIEDKMSRVAVREASVYGEGSPHSYFADLALFVNEGLRTEARDEAVQRVERHSREIAYLAQRGDSRVVRSLYDHSRRPGVDPAVVEREVRLAGGMTSAVNNGGAFIVPSFVVSDFATFNEVPMTAVQNAFTVRDLPNHGMAVSTPRFTSDANYALNPAEGSLLTENDPTSAFATGAVAVAVSEVPSSIQLRQRAEGGFDQFIYAQLRNGLQAQIEQYACQQALTGVSPLAWATYSNASLFARIGQATAGLMTAAGTRLAPKAIVGHPTNIQWLFAQTGSDGLPLFGQGAPAVHGVPVYESLGLPTVSSGTQGQLVVVGDGAVFVYLGQPILDCLPDSTGIGSTGGSANLNVIFRGRQYVSVVQRYPAGIATIQGAALSLTPTWAS